jgi:hypothetical protein
MFEPPGARPATACSSTLETPCQVSGRPALDAEAASEDLPSMATTLMCRVGRHAWKHKVNDEARPYKECARCGKCTEQQGGKGYGDMLPFIGGNGVN